MWQLVERTHSLFVAMMAGEALSLIVVKTEMLASYVVSGTEDSLADCQHDVWGSLIVITTEMLASYV